MNKLLDNIRHMRWHNKNRDYRNAQKRAQRLAVKRECLIKYGLACVCGEDDIDVLTIDHIQSCGSNREGNGYNLYYKLKQRNWPSGYRTMCFNCNVKKYIISKRTSERLYSNKWSHRLKRAILQHYGGVCTVCGENDLDVLNLDHINNDGQHGRGGIGEYSKIKQAGYPNIYQVLCFNHNYKKHLLHLRSNQPELPRYRPLVFKTHCSKGHIWQPNNLTGRNGCKQCKKNNYNTWRRRKQGERICV